MGPVKILESRNYFEKDQLKTVYAEVEKNTPDIQAFIRTSIKKASEQKKVKPKKQPVPKEVVPAKKKKKKMPEGGC
jgi:hypothetical protein